MTYIQSCLNTANSLFNFPTLYTLLWVASSFTEPSVLWLKLSRFSLYKGDRQSLNGDFPKQMKAREVTVNLNIDTGLFIYLFIVLNIFWVWVRKASLVKPELPSWLCRMLSLRGAYKSPLISEQKDLSTQWLTRRTCIKTLILLQHMVVENLLLKYAQLSHPTLS